MSRKDPIFEPKASLSSSIPSEKRGTPIPSSPSSPYLPGMFKFPSAKTTVGFGAGQQQIFIPDSLTLK